MGNLIKIREISLKYDISARTLRYYEDMGLIQSTRSNDYAYRLYNDNAVKRLEQILILRKLNISIRDIQRIFNSGNSGVVLEVLSKKVTTIDDEVALLHELKDIVLDFIKQINESDFQKSTDVRLLYEKAKELEQHLVNIKYSGNSSPVKRLINVTEKLEKKPDVRIVELPKCKMVSSGCDMGNGLLDEFNIWWSAVDKQRTDKFFPRDFMWYDLESKGTFWYYAINDNITDTGGFEVLEFEGGLYAAAVSKDGDDNDGWRVYSGIKEWIDNSGYFEVDERQGHYHMCHVITPSIAGKAMGYAQLEIYVHIMVSASLA
ncbi:Nodulation protein NolA [Sporomusa ovata DSM 2662]|uniref:Transcriptional regulator, MerR family n=2 Tax=Sporomusa ovata TaxID=2378 RepID=A0A0U1L4J6_9FIRM|nr:transcriptional regulator, MerR family [Sporomusa ovata DSM 2662]CQR74632.1 Transcriptional regulator, MerR family [Sporomusa ovata]